MMERRQIVRLWQQGGAAVLITLVRAEGSSYRRPGARLLLGAHGEYAGTISGGCLETEVLRKAAWMVREGAVIERYSTMFDDTAEVPFGLGCGGVVDLLFEPADTPECRALMAALEGAKAGAEMTVLTWLPHKRRGLGLARAVLAASGDFIFASERLTESELVEAHAGVLRRDWVESAPTEVFVERIAGLQRLFVMGAGGRRKAAGEHGCSAGVERSCNGWTGAVSTDGAVSGGRTRSGNFVCLRRCAGDPAGGRCRVDDP